MPRLFPSLVLLSSFALASCGDDAAPPAANVAWQIQCATALNCPGEGNREIVSFDGENGHVVACSARTDTFGNLRFDLLEASAPTRGYGFEIRGLAVNPETLVLVSEGSCEVDVLANNEYRGDCGSRAPTPERPCEVAITRIEGGVVQGFLRCDGIPLRASAESRLRLLGADVRYDPSIALQGQGAGFAFDNCDGL